MNARLVCPGHLKKIKSKHTNCFACGNEIFNSSIKQAKLPFLCADCDPSWETRRACKAIRIESKENEDIDDDTCIMMMSKSECIFRPLCVEIHIKKDFLPCNNCHDFEKKDDMDQLEYNINLAQLDSFIKNNINHEIGKKRWGKIFEKRERDLRKTR
jgi:hypothetical protein